MCVVRTLNIGFHIQEASSLVNIQSSYPSSPNFLTNLFPQTEYTSTFHPPNHFKYWWPNIILTFFILFATSKIVNRITELSFIWLFTLCCESRGEHNVMNCSTFASADPDVALTEANGPLPSVWPNMLSLFGWSKWTWSEWNEVNVCLKIAIWGCCK